MEDTKQKIALFIDADNAPANKFEDVLSDSSKVWRSDYKKGIW